MLRGMGDSSMATARGPAAARTATLPSRTDPGTRLPHRSPRLQRLLLHFLLRFLLLFQPGGNLLLGLLFRDAVGFLDLADELVAFARSHVELIIRQLAPLLLGATLELLPIAFNTVPVHIGSFLVFGSRSAASIIRSYCTEHSMRARVRRLCARGRLAKVNVWVPALDFHHPRARPGYWSNRLVKLSAFHHSNRVD